MLWIVVVWLEKHKRNLVFPSKMVSADLINAHADFLVAGFILALSLALAFFIHFLMNFYLSTIAKKTGSKLDDILISGLKKPMYVFVLVSGFFLSLLQLEVLAPATDFLVHVYKAAIIMIFAYGASKLSASMFKWQMTRKSASEARVARHFLPLAARAINVFIYVVAAVGLLDQFGVRITALVASIGVVSLAVALALQDTLGNFFAANRIMAATPVTAGDTIRHATGQDGVVADVGWRSTKIRTLTDNMIVMPNSKLSQNILMNYNLPTEETGVIVKVGIAYGSDVDRAEKIVLKVAKSAQSSVSGASKNYEPFVRFSEFGGSNIVANVVLRADDPISKQVITHEVLKGVAREFSRAGIKVK